MPGNGPSLQKDIFFIFPVRVRSRGPAQFLIGAAQDVLFFQTVEIQEGTAGSLEPELPVLPEEFQGRGADGIPEQYLISGLVPGGCFQRDSQRPGKLGQLPAPNRRILLFPAFLLDTQEQLPSG